MAIASATELVEALREYGLLDSTQLADLQREVPLHFPEARALGRELLRRDWLTPYQLNQLLQEHGRQLVLGSYILLARLGEGGMGQVFKAQHRKLGRVVALKVILKERLASAEAARRFTREIAAASQLSHPNVVLAYDAGEADGRLFFAMEYVEGTDLYRLVKAGGPLPVAMACDCVRQASLGLQHIHERGLVHRDIKPANLFLTDKGSVVKILDLGLARLSELVADEDSDTSTLTKYGT